MTNIDANLDLFNSAKSVIKTMDEDDALFCVSFSGKAVGEQKCFASINGSIESLGDMVNCFVEMTDEREKKTFLDSLLVMSLHAAMLDNGFFMKLKGGIKQIEK